MGPGRDYNYPTSSGAVSGGMMTQQIGINGFHITVGMLVVIVLLLVFYNMGRRRR